MYPFFNNLDVTTITNPAVGLLVYNTSVSGSQNNSVRPGFYYWSGSSWIKLFVEGDIDLSIADDAVTSSKIADGTITSSDISSSAAIPFSKLSLTKSDITGLGIPGVDTDTTLSTATLSGTTLVLTDSVSNTYTVDLTSIDTDTDTTYTAGSGLVLSGTSFRLADEAIFSGTVTANYFVGDGSGLTGVSATSIADDAVTSSKIADGTITSSDISSSAAIPFSKLSLTKSDITGLGIPGVDTDTTYSAGTGLSLNEGVFSIESSVVTSNYGGSLTINGALIANSFVGNGSSLTDISGNSLSDNSVTTSKILDGTILNSDISTLAAIVDTKLATITTSGKVANSATTATSNNTASAIVARDASGDFQATDISLSGSITGGDSATSKISGFSAEVTVKNASYTLSASDNGHFLRFDSSSATTLTIPSGLPIGFNCTVIQYGTGQVTFASSGTTLKNRSSLTKTAGQYSMVSIVSVTTNVFVLSGEMSN